MNIKYKIVTLFFLFIVQVGFTQNKTASTWQSSHVYMDESGMLTYTPDKQGNTIPDFSRVGYHHGTKSIPCYPVVKIITPVEGDNWGNIQMAIDEISKKEPDRNGHRGTILLSRGEYQVSKSIVISTSGIVLKGEGDNVNETRIIATGRKRYPLIEIKGEGRYQEIINSRVKITDEFVPVGSHSFRVTSVDPFKIGDRIIVFRPGTTQWIEAIRMNLIAERPGTRQWKADEYNLAFEREITGIEGNCIFIDNPIVMQMEKQYGGGEVYKYRFDGRIQEVGVSDMYLESEYQAEDDTEHGWIAIQLDNAENCWVKNIYDGKFRLFGCKL